MMLDLTRDFTIQTVHGVGQKNWEVLASDHAELDSNAVSFEQHDTGQVVVVPWTEIACIRQELREKGKPDVL